MHYLSKALPLALILVLTSCFPSPPRSRPLKPGNELVLDRGEVRVHIGSMKEVRPGRRRINFGDLLEPKTVFDHLKTTRQSERSSARVRQWSGAVDVSTGLALQSLTTNANNSDSETMTWTGTTSTSPEGTTESISEGAAGEATSSNEVGATYARPTGGSAPATLLAPGLPDSSSLSASYHSLLYATAETVLAGQALESLFNVETIPDGYLMVSVPLLVSIHPGRVTRENYVVRTELSMWNTPSCGISDMKVLAVAPLGLTRFYSDEGLVASVLQLSASAGIPVSAALAQLRAGFSNEELESLAQIGRRPEFQVGIRDQVAGEDAVQVELRYLGHEALSGNVHLAPATLNAEILLLVATSALDDKKCHGELRTVIERTGDKPDKQQALEGLGKDKARIQTLVTQFASEPIPSPSVGLSSSGKRVALFYAGTKTTFLPTEELTGFGEWSITRPEYQQGSHQPVELHIHPRLPATIGAVAQAAGGQLLVALSEADRSRDWALCLAIPRESAPHEVLGYRHTHAASKAQVTSLRFTVDHPMAKDGPALAAITYDSVNCATDFTSRASAINWFPVNVKLLKAVAPPAEKAIRLTSVQGTLESNAIVVRLEYEAPLASLVVTLNGALATVRKLEPRLKDGKPVGGVVYAAIPQALTRKNDPDRRIHVDVAAKGYQSAAADIRAIW